MYYFHTNTTSKYVADLEVFQGVEKDDFGVQAKKNISIILLFLMTFFLFT